MAEKLIMYFVIIRIHVDYLDGKWTHAWTYLFEFLFSCPVILVHFNANCYLHSYEIE